MALNSEFFWRYSDIKRDAIRANLACAPSLPGSLCHMNWDSNIAIAANIWLLTPSMYIENGILAKYVEVFRHLLEEHVLRHKTQAVRSRAEHLQGV